MKVAVYGTLKFGYPNYGVMKVAGGKLIGKGITKQLYTMRSLGGFPAVFIDDPRTNIHVEVYEVDNIQPLDWLEGYPHMYDRKEIEVSLDDGSEEEAFIYFMKEDRGRPIVESGCW